MDDNYQLRDYPEPKKWIELSIDEKIPWLTCRWNRHGCFEGFELGLISGLGYALENLEEIRFDSNKDREENRETQDQLTDIYLFGSLFRLLNYFLPMLPLSQIPNHESLFIDSISEIIGISKFLDS